MLGCISVPSADMHISLDFAANCWPFPRNCALSDLPQTPLELIERLKADMERGDPKKAVCAVWRQVSPGNYTIVNYIAAEKSLHRVRTDASEMLDEMPAEDLLVILERMAQSEQSSDVSRLLPAPQARFELRPSAATAARTARAARPARPAAPAPAEREEVQKEEVKETQKAAQNAPQASTAAKAAPQPAKTTTTVATTATVAHKHHAANGYAIPDRFIHPERAAAQARAQRLAQEEKLRAEQEKKKDAPTAVATPVVDSSTAAVLRTAAPQQVLNNSAQGDLFQFDAGSAPAQVQQELICNKKESVAEKSQAANEANPAPAAASEKAPAEVKSPDRTQAFTEFAESFELTAASEQTVSKMKTRGSKTASARTTRTTKGASATATKKPRTKTKKASVDAAQDKMLPSDSGKTAQTPTASKRSRRKKEPLSPVEAQKSSAEFALESEFWPRA